MIENIAKRMVEQLLAERLISEEKKDVYQYGMIMLIERLVTISSLIFLAFWKNVLIPGVIFMVFFFALRKRTGGFHASTFIGCYTLSLLSFYMLTIVDDYCLTHLIVLQLITFVAATIILINGTINHPNMHMSKGELDESKRKARYVVVAEVICWIAFENWSSISRSSCIRLYDERKYSI